MVTAAAKAFAASSIAVADIRPDNLPVAQELGAKHVLDLSANKSPEAAVHAVRDVFGSEGPDIIIDCAGFESTISVSCLCINANLILNTGAPPFIDCTGFAAPSASHLVGALVHGGIGFKDGTLRSCVCLNAAHVPIG